MSKIEIILFITAAMSLLVTAKMYNDQVNPKKKSKHICIYNDCPLCFEIPCSDCDNKTQCKRCCSENCKNCGGYVDIWRLNKWLNKK